MGNVVLVEDVTTRFGQVCAKARTRLLAIPVEQAPRIHRLMTVAEVKDVLCAVITEAMEDLAQLVGDASQKR